MPLQFTIKNFGPVLNRTVALDPITVITDEGRSTILGIIHAFTKAYHEQLCQNAYEIAENCPNTPILDQWRLEKRPKEIFKSSLKLLIK